MAKKKKSLNLSTKLKFKKPSKRLSYLPTDYYSFKNTVPRFGAFAVQSIEYGIMTRNQIEALRVAFRRPIKKYGNARVWALLKPDRILTKRSAETRMGRGKGTPVSQVALVHKGQLLFEIQGPPVAVMRRVFEKSKKKLPVRSVLISING